MRLFNSARPLALSLVFITRSASGQGTTPRDIPAVGAGTQVDSNDAEALYQAGLAAHRAKAMVEARSLFAAAVRTDPKLAVGYIALAQFHHTGTAIVIEPDRILFVPPSSGAIDSARLLLRRAFQINPFIDDPSRHDIPNYWAGTLKLALHHYHKGDYALAFDKFGTVIKRTQKPGHPEKVPEVALWYHILTAMQLGRYDDAISDARVLLEAARTFAEKDQAASDRRVGDIHYILADLNRAAGHASAAEDLYLLVAQNDLGFYMAHARLADLYQAQGRWDQAIVERHRAIDANPEDPSLVFDLGVTLANAHHDSEAERVLQEALQANPRETRAVYVLALVQVRLGKVTAARDAFNRFLALAPSRYTTMRDDAQRQLASLQ